MKYLEQFESICYGCGEKFWTYINIETGDVAEIFCTNSCISKYYSIKEKRNRKIKIILED